MSDISYDEAVRTIMREHKVTEATAGYMVADLYPELVALDGVSEHLPDIRFDHVDPEEGAGLVHHVERPAGRPVPVDDEPSPAWAVEAQKARTAAQIEGDRYRNMSRRTSFHSVDD